MKRSRLFLDTSYVLALLNVKDDYHVRANALLDVVEKAGEVFVTTHVLAEVCDELSRSSRSVASQAIIDIMSKPNVKTIHVTEPIFWEAFELYCQRGDKTWGLTDCISFVVMQERGLTHALTTDRHFTQAGFHSALFDTSTTP